MTVTHLEWLSDLGHCPAVSECVLKENGAMSILVISNALITWSTLMKKTTIILINTAPWQNSCPITSDTTIQESMVLSIS